MRILFDRGTPVPLSDSLQQHEISTAFERGWSKLKNGELLEVAEHEGFDVFVTTDSNLNAATSDRDASLEARPSEGERQGASKTRERRAA